MRIEQVVAYGSFSGHIEGRARTGRSQTWRGYDTRRRRRGDPAGATQIDWAVVAVLRRQGDAERRVLPCEGS